MNRATIARMDEDAISADWETDLVALLTDLSGVQDELLDVLVQKRDRMVQRDVKGIEQVQQREQRLCGRLQACHDRRRELLDQAAAQGLPSESIGKLAKVVTDRREGSLGKQVKQASAKMRLLQHQSLTNWVLAQRTLLHLSQMLEIIATGGRLQPTYGKSEFVHSRGSLVDREV